MAWCELTCDTFQELKKLVSKDGTILAKDLWLAAALHNDLLEISESFVYKDHSIDMSWYLQSDIENHITY